MCVCVRVCVCVCVCVCIYEMFFIDWQEGNTVQNPKKVYPKYTRHCSREPILWILAQVIIDDVGCVIINGKNREQWKALPALLNILDILWIVEAFSLAKLPSYDCLVRPTHGCHMHCVFALSHSLLPHALLFMLSHTRLSQALPFCTVTLTVVTCTAFCAVIHTAITCTAFCAVIQLAITCTAFLCCHTHCCDMHCFLRCHTNCRYKHWLLRHTQCRHMHCLLSYKLCLHMRCLLPTAYCWATDYAFTSTDFCITSTQPSHKMPIASWNAWRAVQCC